jgi:hypothetical protein
MPRPAPRPPGDPLQLMSLPIDTNLLLRLRQAARRIFSLVLPDTVCYDSMVLPARHLWG